MADTPKPNEKADDGDTVCVHYTGKLSDGSVFDSSVQRGEPISFTLGAGEMIPGFEKAVRGMKVGDTRSFVAEPDEAYGDREDDAVVTITRELLGELDGQVRVGDPLSMQTDRGAVLVTVSAIEGDRVTLDANHPLAGKTLSFDIEMMRIQKKAG